MTEERRTTDGPVERQSADEPVRCRVCGREFPDDAALERHVRDAGLLW